LKQAALKFGVEGPSEPAQLAQAEEQQTGLLQHINFFEEHEARELHPEVIFLSSQDQQQREACPEHTL
jgi:hypothetical protein